jgi:hypothetical protein
MSKVMRKAAGFDQVGRQADVVRDGSSNLSDL